MESYGESKGSRRVRISGRGTSTTGKPAVSAASDWYTLALHGYSKDEARALKAHLADWLKTNLKLTLSPNKTVITHWTDRVTFLGFELRGIRSRTNGVAKAPRLIISHAAEQRVRHTIAKLTRRTSIGSLPFTC
jgi:hypothetical protein